MDKARRATQAPSRAACRGALWREPEMPLLTELETDLERAHCYKHDAPNEAIRSAQGNIQAEPDRRFRHGSGKTFELNLC